MAAPTPVAVITMADGQELSPFTEIKLFADKVVAVCPLAFEIGETLHVHIGGAAGKAFVLRVAVVERDADGVRHECEIVS